MPPALITLIIQEALTNGPKLARQIVELWHKGDPTKEDWEKLFSATENRTYDQIVHPT
jgi:hypothetical protein